MPMPIHMPIDPLCIQDKCNAKKDMQAIKERALKMAMKLSTNKDFMELQSGVANAFMGKATKDPILSLFPLITKVLSNKVVCSEVASFVDFLAKNMKNKSDAEVKKMLTCVTKTCGMSQQHIRAIVNMMVALSNFVSDEKLSRSLKQLMDAYKTNFMRASRVLNNMKNV